MALLWRSVTLICGALEEHLLTYLLTYHYAETGPPMLASLHCKHPGVCPFWHGAPSVDGGLFGAYPTQTDGTAVCAVCQLSRQTAQTDAWQIIYTVFDEKRACSTFATITLEKLIKFLWMPYVI